MFRYTVFTCIIMLFLSGTGIIGIALKLRLGVYKKAMKAILGNAIRVVFSFVLARGFGRPVGQSIIPRFSVRIDGVRPRPRVWSTQRFPMSLVLLKMSIT